jgi:hypothetical protein
MSETDTAKRRAQVLRRLQSGEKVGAVAAACGVSNSTVYRWRRENSSTATKSAPARRSLSKRSAAVPPAPLPSEGYVGDITGPGITDTWGVTCTDLGDDAAGANTAYAQQLWAYVHDNPPWNQGGISTVIPPDVLVDNLGRTRSRQQSTRATVRRIRPSWLAAGHSGGVGLMVSQWDTATGWPYRMMQFKVTLSDTTATSNGAQPATKPGRAARTRVTRQPRRKDPRAGRSKR